MPAISFVPNVLNRKFPDVPYFLVIPAKAGIHGEEYDASIGLTPGRVASSVADRNARESAMALVGLEIKSREALAGGT